MEEEVILHCSVCGEVFSRKSALQLHTMVHAVQLTSGAENTLAKEYCVASDSLPNKEFEPTSQVITAECAEETVTPTVVVKVEIQSDDERETTNAPREHAISNIDRLNAKDSSPVSFLDPVFNLDMKNDDLCHDNSIKLVISENSNRGAISRSKRKSPNAKIEPKGSAIKRTKRLSREPNVQSAFIDLKASTSSVSKGPKLRNTKSTLNTLSSGTGTSSSRDIVSRSTLSQNSSSESENSEKATSSESENSEKATSSESENSENSTSSDKVIKTSKLSRRIQKRKSLCDEKKIKNRHAKSKSSISRSTSNMDSSSNPAKKSMSSSGGVRLEAPSSKIINEVHVVTSDGENSIDSLLPETKVCDDCGFTFKTDTVWKEHRQRVHGKIDFFKCSQCEFQTKSGRAMAHHKKLHDSGCYNCSDCGKGYPNLRSLARHCKTHVPDSPFFCKPCKKRFYNQKLFDTHRANHSTDGVYICFHCRKEFDSLEGLDNHEHVLESFECDVCFRVFDLKCDFVDHYKKHTSKSLQIELGPHKCSKCLRGFDTLEVLEQHTFECSNQKTLDCSSCWEQFSTEFDIKSHQCRRGYSNEENDESASVKIEAAKSVAKFKTVTSQTETLVRAEGSSVIRRRIPVPSTSIEIEPITSLNSTAESELGVIVNPMSAVKNTNSAKGVANKSVTTRAKTLTSKKSRTPDASSKYFKRARKAESYRCSDCDKTFPFLQAWKVHRQTTHGDNQPFKCRICNAKFECYTILKDHTLSHTDIG